MVPWPGILWCAWSRKRHTLPYNNNTLFISFLTPVDNSFLTLKYDKTIWKRILDHCKTKETCPQISQSRKMFFFQLRWWDFLFFVRQLKCCGVSGPSDWKNSSWYKNSDRSEPYPESCCKNPTAKCSVSPKKEDIYQDVSMAIISSGAGWNGDPWKLLARSTLLQNIGMIS